jgi:hypothetical protein
MAPVRSAAIRISASSRVQPLGADLPLERRSNLLLGLWTEFDRHKLLGARAQTPADIIAGDHEVPPALVDAAHQQVDMRI